MGFYVLYVAFVLSLLRCTWIGIPSPVIVTICVNPKSERTGERRGLCFIVSTHNPGNRRYGFVVMATGQ